MKVMVEDFNRKLRDKNLIVITIYLIIVLQYPYSIPIAIFGIYLG